MNLKPIEKALADVEFRPWRLSTHGDMVMVPGPIREQPLVIRTPDGTFVMSYENAWLVSHAPTWLEALVAEVKWMREELVSAWHEGKCDHPEQSLREFLRMTENEYAAYIGATPKGGKSLE